MSDETTTTTTDVSPDAILAALKATGFTPELLAAFRQADQAAKAVEKAERDREKAENQRRFENMRDEVAFLVSAIQSQGFKVQTWHKREKGVKTDQISGVGFYVSGTQTLNIGGVLREVRVSTYVKWSPDGKSAPAEIAGED